jgi:hypothetical protein
MIIVLVFPTNKTSGKGVIEQVSCFCARGLFVSVDHYSNYLLESHPVSENSICCVSSSFSSIESIRHANQRAMQSKMQISLKTIVHKVSQDSPKRECTM